MKKSNKPKPTPTTTPPIHPQPPPSELDLNESLTTPRVDILIQVVVDPRYRTFPLNRILYDVRLVSNRLHDLIRGFIYMVNPSQTTESIQQIIEAGNDYRGFGDLSLDCIKFQQQQQQQLLSKELCIEMISKLYHLSDNGTFPKSCILAVAQFLLPLMSIHKKIWLELRSFIRDTSYVYGTSLLSSTDKPTSEKIGGNKLNTTTNATDQQDASQLFLFYARAIANRLCRDVSFQKIPSSLPSSLFTTNQLCVPILPPHSRSLPTSAEIRLWSTAMKIEAETIAPQCLIDVIEILRIIYTVVQLENSQNHTTSEFCILTAMLYLDHLSRAGLFHYHNGTPPTKDMTFLFFENPIYSATSSSSSQSLARHLGSFPFNTTTSTTSTNKKYSQPHLVCSVCWSRLTSMDPPVTFSDGESICSCCRNKKRRQLTGDVTIFPEKEEDDHAFLNKNASDELAEMFGSAPDLVLNKALESSSHVRESVILRREGNRLFRTAQDYQAALELYDQALKVDVEGTPAIFSNKSAVYIELKNGIDAVKCACEAIVSSCGKWGKAYFRLHVALELCLVLWTGKALSVRESKRNVATNNDPLSSSTNSILPTDNTILHPTLNLTSKQITTLSMSSLFHARALGERVRHRIKRLMKRLFTLPSSHELLQDIAIELARPRLAHHVIFFGQPLGDNTYYEEWTLLEAIKPIFNPIQIQQRQTRHILPSLLWENYNKMIQSPNIQPIVLDSSLKPFMFQAELSGLIRHGDVVIGINGICVDCMSVSRVTQLVDRVSKGNIILTLYRPSSQTMMNVCFDGQHRLGVDLLEPRDPPLPSSQSLYHYLGLADDAKGQLADHDIDINSTIVTMGIPRCMVDSLSRPTPNGSMSLQNSNKNNVINESLLRLRSCFAYAICLRKINVPVVVGEMNELQKQQQQQSSSSQVIRFVENDIIDWFHNVDDDSLSANNNNNKTTHSVPSTVISTKTISETIRLWIINKSQCVEAIDEITEIKSRYDRALEYQNQILQLEQIPTGTLVSRQLDEEIEQARIKCQRDLLHGGEFISRFPEPPYTSSAYVGSSSVLSTMDNSSNVLVETTSTTTTPQHHHHHHQQIIIPSSLRNEFDCNLCYGLLCLPSTLPCGHSFCNPCAVRAVDHATIQGSPSCPLCRYNLSDYIIALNTKALYRYQSLDILDFGLAHVAINRALHSLLRDAFPEEYQSRLASIQHDEMVITKEVLVELGMKKSSLTVTRRSSSSSNNNNHHDEEESTPVPTMDNDDDDHDMYFPIVPFHIPLCPSIPASMVLWDPGERLMIRRVIYNAAIAAKKLYVEQQQKGAGTTTTTTTIQNIAELDEKLIQSLETYSGGSINQTITEAGSASFGFVYSKKTELFVDGLYDANVNPLYGVMLEIDSLDQDENGGLKIWGSGGPRFMVKQMLKHDGYVVARAKMLDKKIHGNHISKKEIDNWKNSLVSVSVNNNNNTTEKQLQQQIEESVDTLIMEAIQTEWVNTPNILLSIALKKLSDACLDTLPSPEERQEREPCCESSIPYFIAVFCQFPHSFLHGMNFIIPQLSESHFERARFVLRVTRNKTHIPVRIDQELLDMLKRHYTHPKVQDIFNNGLLLGHHDEFDDEEDLEEEDDEQDDEDEYDQDEEYDDADEIDYE
jgi:hypothetical protein